MVELIADRDEQRITDEELDKVNQYAEKISVGYPGKAISFWKDSRGFCMEPFDDTIVFVYETKRALFRALKKELDKRLGE